MVKYTHPKTESFSRHTHGPRCCPHMGTGRAHLSLPSSLLPHKLHVQRFKLGGRLPAVLVHVGDVLGQPGNSGGKEEHSFWCYVPCAPTLYLLPSASPSPQPGRDKVFQEILSVSALTHHFPKNCGPVSTSRESEGFPISPPSLQIIPKGCLLEC